MKLLDGKETAQKLINEVKIRLTNLPKLPHLAILIVGDDYASQMYVSMKQRKAQKLGINCTVFRFNKEVQEQVIIEKIDKLNNDISTTGVMIQLPLSRHIDTINVVNRISYKKDVDGLGAYNLGRIFQNDPYIIPATALGVIRLFERYKIDLLSKNVVIVGTSPYIGKPLAGLLLNKKSTVTLCNRKTKNLSLVTSKADILISATGNPKMIKSNWVKEGAVVVDVGIAKDPLTGNLCGDVDFEDVKDKVGYITPVPGGVGPMTIASLLENVVNFVK